MRIFSVFYVRIFDSTVTDTGIQCFIFGLQGFRYLTLSVSTFCHWYFSTVTKFKSILIGTVSCYSYLGKKISPITLICRRLFLLFTFFCCFRFWRYVFHDDCRFGLLVMIFILAKKYLGSNLSP